MYYLLKDFLNSQFDPTNKRAQTLNMLVTCVGASVAAIIAMPTLDTSVPKLETIHEAVQESVYKQAKTIKDRAKECRNEIDRTSRDCAREQTKSVCQKWVDQVQVCKGVE